MPTITGNTGNIKVVTLLKVYKNTGLPVIDSNGHQITKSNVVGDPDYIAPYLDLCDCPVDDIATGCVPTTTAPTTTAPTTTAATTTATPTTTSMCSLMLSWLPYSITCLPNGTTQSQISVTGNAGHQVEFWNPNTMEFEDGNTLNTYILIVPSNGILVSCHARVKGCIQEIQGFITACSPSGTTSPTTTMLPTTTVPTTTTVAPTTTAGCTPPSNVNISGGTVFNNRQTVTFTATYAGSTGGTFVWVLGAGQTLISGGNGYSYCEVQFTTVGTTLLYCQVTKCGITSSATLPITVNCVTPTIISQNAVCNNVFTFNANVVLSHGQLQVISGGTITSVSGNSYILNSTNLSGIVVRAFEGSCSTTFTIENPDCGCTPIAGATIAGVLTGSVGQTVTYNVTYSGSTPTSIDWVIPAGVTLQSGGDGTTFATVLFNTSGTKVITCTVVNECNFDSDTISVIVT
jgi:hypothetical protein